MVEALTDDTLVQEAPAIVGRLSPSALAHAGVVRGHAPQPEAMSFRPEEGRHYERP